MRFLVVTGLSGAGKSTVLRQLEDGGYLCVDNLPPVMIMKFIELCSQASTRIARVAIAVDIRSGEFFDANSVRGAIESAREAGYTVDLLFLEANDDALIHRYKETRRDHPLADADISLSEAIAMERDRIQPLREAANYVLDTTGLRVRELTARVQRLLEQDESLDQRMRVEVLSFGYKRGVPRESDLVFDVRFLPNPFYIPEIRLFTGLEEPIREFVLLGNDVTKEFLRKLYDMLAFLMPHYREEGKSRLMIAIGCTGGAHRSVAISEALAAHLREEGYPVDVNHRDIEKEQALWQK